MTATPIGVNSTPGPTLRARVTGLLLRTVGRTSDSVRLGFERGFDSGEMMDRIYQDRASGRFLVGRLADRIYLDQPGCRGLRGRKQLLESALSVELDRLRALGEPLVVVDVASGPATYLVDLLARTRPADVRAIARDLDEHGLTRGRELARERGVTAIEYVRGDALDADGLLAIDPAPRVVIASGFYELVDDAIVGASMGINRRLLAPGGVFLFTTQVAHPQVDIMAMVPNRFGEPWIIRNRPIADAERLAHRAGFREVRSTFEPSGIFAVTVCRP